MFSSLEANRQYRSFGQDSAISAERAGVPNDDFMLTWWVDKPVTSQPRNARQPMIAHSLPLYRIASLHCSFVASVTARPDALCTS
ncbi:Extracellular protein [Fusarium oxysporum f. sp. albedinis]|nr:Extracellular protein [Fusarium oxysporum f. sp. albedinis]